MFTIDQLKSLKNGDGATLKNGNMISYPGGYQVATDGITTTDVMQAWKAIKEYNDSCGIWIDDDIYYIDRSFHFNDLEDAKTIGKAFNQISILDWNTMECIYL